MAVFTGPVQGKDWQWQARSVTQGDIYGAILETQHWKPMSSAPRDGTKIIAVEIGAPHRERTCYFHQASPQHAGMWVPMEGGILLPFRPSVWRELKPTQDSPPEPLPAGAP